LRVLAEDFELVALANGVVSLRSVVYGQTFHPVVGPVAEAEAVHLAGTRALARANAFAGEAGFTIWDIGLGAAANATALISHLLAGYTGNGNIHLLSFDRDLSAIDFALAQAAELGYPAAHRELLQTLRREGSAVAWLAGSNRQVEWSVCVADFPSRMAALEPLPAPHAVFFDPYSPAVNRDMWTLELFVSLRARLRADVPCLLTTYTRSTAVRVTLLLAGFYVGIGHATGEKDQTTIAANDPSLLERPLGVAWLEKKVYASTNAAPLRAQASLQAQTPISESDYAMLQAHPQFRT
jgi:tRNA U34 5-methylaminomethyl-2-thiouridine-forming methyltransferase MnmC